MTHLSEVGARAGAADHLESEALYLHDPDRLGIEVLTDRVRVGNRPMVNRVAATITISA